MPALTPVALGVVCALIAYGSWGLLPLYWKALQDVDAAQVLAHRIVWTVAFVGLLLMLLPRRRFAWTRRAVATLAATAVLIAVNWLIYIWAVQAERVLETSLGYFINPLVNVLLGRLVLGESLRPRQRLAVALAALGVAALAIGAEGVPWVALSLAVSFGFYGLLRKMTPADPLLGLGIETALLLPAALGFLAWTAAQGVPVFGTSAAEAALLAGSGVATAVPLIAFAAAAARLRLSTLGFFQYLAPSTHFLLAVLVFGEPVLPVHAVTFGCIWLALALYAGDGWAAARRARLDARRADT